MACGRERRPCRPGMAGRSRCRRCWWRTNRRRVACGSCRPFLRDISSQRRREAELRESEERFRMLSDAATDGIAVTRAGRFLEVNRAWCRMFGYTESELEDMPAAAVVLSL